MIHIKLVVSKLGNEVFDYPQVSTTTGQVEGITIVLKNKVIPVFGMSDTYYTQAWVTHWCGTKHVGSHFFQELSNKVWMTMFGSIEEGTPSKLQVNEVRQRANIIKVP